MASLMPKDFAAWRATHPRIAGGENMTRQELADRQQAIRSRIVEINTEFADQRYPEDVRSEWNDLNDEFDRNEETLRELNARAERVATIARAATEEATDTAGGAERGAGFHTQSPNRGENVWDYSHVRGAVSIEGQKQMLRDQAMRAVERTSFYQPRSGGFERGEAAARPTVRDEDARAHVQWLLDTQDDEHGTVARRVLNTGNPLYQRAFGKAVFDKPTTAEEQRALGLTNTAGGYAVPFTLDPTIIPTSNYSVNPYRAIANVKQITGTTWQGVTSAGVVATRRAEGDEAADNSPTLAQPSVTPQRVDVFIPYSMEIGMDWAGMQGEMARLIADAKDDEEAASFTTGSGTPPAAQGIVTGATTTVTAGGTAVVLGRGRVRARAGAPAAVPGARVVRRQPVRVQQGPAVRHAGRREPLGRQPHPRAAERRERQRRQPHARLPDVRGDVVRRRRSRPGRRSSSSGTSATSRSWTASAWTSRRSRCCSARTVGRPGSAASSPSGATTAPSWTAAAFRVLVTG
jgi:hypothetical protein